MKKHRKSFCRIFFLVFAAAFLFPATPSFSYEREIANLTSILSAEIAKSGKKSLAVVDFTDLQGQVNELGRFIAEEMSGNMTQLSQTSGIDVLDRNHIKRILEEQKLSMSGLVDPRTIKKVGRLAGTDIIITGTITPFGDSIRVSCKAIDTETGKVIGSARGDIAKTATIADLLKLGVSETGKSATTPPAADKPAPVTRIFDKPTYKGYRIDLCLNWANLCVKPAADRFCQMNKYREAKSWKIAYDIGDVTPTYILGDDRICDQKFCDGFETIECQ